MLSPYSFFPSLPDDSFIKPLIDDSSFVWELLPKIKPFLDSFLDSKQVIRGNIDPNAYLSDCPLFIDEGAIIEPGAFIQGPAYIGKNAVVRHGAYVRENVILLDNSIIGHASEAKNSIFLDSAHAPHFNYIGDSILGHRANIGAGTKLSNLTVVSKKDSQTGKRPTIKFKIQGKTYDTKLAKMGAILGDNSQTGCNSVLNPGTLVGPNSLIYANLSLRKGYYPPNTIIKLRQKIEFDELRTTD